MNVGHLIVSIGVACCVASTSWARAQQVVTVDVAQALLRPDGQPEQHTQVTLRHNWDKSFPGIGGRATYTLQLPPIDSTEPSALLFDSLGNQALVRVNGVLVREFGTLGDSAVETRFSQMILVPRGLLQTDRSNQLVVEASMQPLRVGGLSRVRFGPAGPIEAMQSRQRLWDQSASAAYGACFLLMGGLAAGLWWRQRDPLYGCFSLLAFFGMVRHLDHVFDSIPVPWLLWGAVLAISYGCHLALIVRFVLLALGRNPVPLVRAIYSTGAAVIVLASLSFWLLVPALWTGALALLELVAAACFVWVLPQALRSHQRLAWLMLGAGSVMLLAGIHDIVLVRMGLLGGSSLALTPHAIFFLVLILAGVVVERYSRSVADYRALNEHLAERVAQRERQLGEAFETLRAQREEQVVQSERQRMMREIHDGIGSQLVGLLNMVNKPDANPQQLEEQVRLALDEMRMAVDSLQPTLSDLVTVLATLRYRLQPRLHAAGLEVVWDVGTLPPISPLSPQSLWQVQRILLEAFTNVLKHAGATRVTVHASYRDGAEPGVVVSVSDNGCGLAGRQPKGAGTVAGHGMANMRARAAAIGASLCFEPGPGGGTRVVMQWTLPGATPNSPDAPYKTPSTLP